MQDNLPRTRRLRPHRGNKNHSNLLHFNLGNLDRRNSGELCLVGLFYHQTFSITNNPISNVNKNNNNANDSDENEDIC